MLRIKAIKTMFRFHLAYPAGSKLHPTLIRVRRRASAVLAKTAAEIKVLGRVSISTPIGNLLMTKKLTAVISQAIKSEVIFMTTIPITLFVEN